MDQVHLWVHTCTLMHFYPDTDYNTLLGSSRPLLEPSSVPSEPLNVMNASRTVPEESSVTSKPSRKRESKKETTQKFPSHVPKPPVNDVNSMQVRTCRKVLFCEVLNSYIACT